MSIRERWQRAREQGKKIDEAVERGLTPEQKLAINRTQTPSIIFPVFFIILVTVVFALVIISISTRYALEEAFGENEWDNFSENGWKHAKSEINIDVFTWFPVLVAVLLIGLYFFEFFVWARRSNKFRREILARLEAGEKGG